MPFECFNPVPHLAEYSSFDELLSEHDREEIDDDAKIQALALEDSPQLFIHHNALATGMKKSLQGFAPNIDLNHVTYDWLWLQK